MPCVGVPLLTLPVIWQSDSLPCFGGAGLPALIGSTGVNAQCSTARALCVCVGLLSQWCDTASHIGCAELFVLIGSTGVASNCGTAAFVMCVLC
jgi:hypothetical protein